MTSMKVILKRDVKGLGREGDMKEVKDGYARNFLLPSGAAATADKGTVANWERHRDQREERDRAVRTDAEATAATLREMKIEIQVKAGEKGRLFGAVTNREIAHAIAEQGVEIDRHEIRLREPIKTLGEHRAEVHLIPGVDATVTVSVVAAPA
jgi:large subunit ribosomal protein L9